MVTPLTQLGYRVIEICAYLRAQEKIITPLPVRWPNSNKEGSVGCIIRATDRLGCEPGMSMKSGSHDDKGVHKRFEIVCKLVPLPRKRHEKA